MKRLLLFLLFASAAYGQNFKYEAPLLNQNGQPIVGANVYVCSGEVTPSFTNIPPCSLATVYSDLASTQVITQPIVTVTSPTGSFYFVAPAGTYTLAITGAGVQAKDVITLPTVNNTASVTTCQTFENVVCVSADNHQGWGGADYGAWVMSAIASLPTVNGYKAGQVSLSPALGVVTQSSGVSITSPFVVIKGPGAGALQISCTFNGNCWDYHASPFVIWPGGGMSGFSVVGTGAANADAVGFHIGDVIGAKFDDLAIDNFLGTNSACIWFDNLIGFMERDLIQHVDTGLAEGAQNGCTKDWRWTNTGGTAFTSSFAHNHYIANKFTVFDGQIALSMEGGNHVAEDFWFTGNFASGTTATVFKLSGIAYAGGAPAQLDGDIDVSGECTTPCTTGINMNVGTGNNVFIHSGQGFNDISGLMSNAITGNVVRILNDNLSNGGGVETTWLYGQAFSGAAHPYILNPANPAASRQITIKDPGGSAILPFCLNASTCLFQSKRAVTGCVTTSTVRDVCATPITVTWPTSFADTNYSAGCSPDGVPVALPTAPYIVTKSNGSMTVNYATTTSDSAGWSSIDCWAIHE